MWRFCSLFPSIAMAWCIMNSYHKVVRSIRNTRRAKTEKSTSGLVKCEGFAHCFLRLQWRGASWILATRLYVINKEYYLEVMQRLREAIHQKRTELWKNQSWISHHNNAPADTSMLVREVLAKNKIVIMPELAKPEVLREAIRQKRIELWKNQSWILHHDNAHRCLCLSFKPKTKP